MRTTTNNGKRMLPLLLVKGPARIRSSRNKCPLWRLPRSLANDEDDLEEVALVSLELSEAQRENLFALHSEHPFDTVAEVNRELGCNGFWTTLRRHESKHCCSLAVVASRLARDCHVKEC